MLNKKNNKKIDGIKIIESRCGKNRLKQYDYAICAWGASIGKNIENNHFAKEFYFIIDSKLKDNVINILKNTNWCKEYIMTSTPNLLQWQIIDCLKRKIPNL